MSQPGFLNDPIGFLREGAEKTAARAGKDEFGQLRNPGWFNNMIGAVTGATDAGTKEYSDALKTTALDNRFGSVLGSHGLESVRPGDSEGSILKRIKDARLAEQRDNANFMTDAQKIGIGLQGRKLDAEIENLKAQFGLKTKELTQQGEQFDKTLGLSRDQLNYTKTKDAADREFLTKEQAEKRAEGALGRAHEVELLDMRQGAEMDAYNKNMEIYEREKNANRTAALVSGLASLGALVAV